MINPAMFGVSPQQMEQAKEVGRHLRMEITKYRKQGRLEVRFTLINPDENYDIGEPVDKLCDQLAWGFDTMFDIKGKIINVE
jgi:hypothetical protein